MERAAVLIGVRKVHDLPLLQAAWDGVAKMKAWAEGQGLVEDRIAVVTDEHEPVTPRRIKDAVHRFVQLNVIEQLIVYFSGHGINLGRREYWLLSDAIEDPDAAVNVTASEDLARYAGVGHVVFVSDACRTAAQGIQAQSTTGSVVFRSYATGGPERPVDLFFATLLGAPSLEIRDVGTTSGGYSAVYTATLVEALRGRHSGVKKPDPHGHGLVVQMWDLKNFLANEVPVRVFQATQRSQQPDARITSPPGTWLSRLPDSGLESVYVPVSTRLRSLEGASARAVRTATRPPDEFLSAPAALASMNLDTTVPADRAFKETADAAMRLFGPAHFESRCGFKVSGAGVVRAHLQGAKHDLLDTTALRVWPGDEPAYNAVLFFDNGLSTLLPAVPEFIAALSFEGGELVSVAYTPSDNSARWPGDRSREASIRELRAIVAAATHVGELRLDDEDARKLAERMQLEKSFDPSLALYAAYAYRDQRRTQRIRDMAQYQRDDLNMNFFDLALLARGFDGQPPPEGVFPFLPVLSQGWALLAAHEVRYHADIAAVRPHARLDSLWTLYDHAGGDILVQALSSGRIQP